MQQILENWAACDDNRHFAITYRSTCRETRWRVVVWVKPEGEAVTGLPGEGFGETSEAAMYAAIEAWEKQTRIQRRTGGNFYVPLSLHGLMGDVDESQVRN